MSADLRFDLVVGTGVDPVTFRFSDDLSRFLDQGENAFTQVNANFACPPSTPITPCFPLLIARRSRETPFSRWSRRCGP